MSEESNNEQPVVEPVVEEVTPQTEFQKRVSEADAATGAMIAMYLPKFNMFIANLNNNALRRVINGLMTYPLEEAPRFMDNMEKNAYLIGNRLLEAKFMLIVSTLLQNQQITNALQETVESNNPPQGETNNE